VNVIKLLIVTLLDGQNHGLVKKLKWGTKIMQVEI